MKRILIALLVLVQPFFNLFSQKEIFFSDIKTEDIKVESLHGVEIGSSINLIPLFQHTPSYDKSYRIPFGIGYFDEKCIAPSWTLIYSANLSYTFSRMLNYSKLDSVSGGYHYTSSNYIYQNSYSLGLSIGIEPRWYLGYKHRYEVGKATLNSGWYVSLPIGIGATPVNTYKSEVSSDFISYVGLSSALTLGCRQAISKKWFLEGNVTLIAIGTNLYRFNKKLNVSTPDPTFLPGIGLSAAYTFK